jgi:hypothetical protein
VLANKIPGPAVFENLDNFSFKMLNLYQYAGIDKIDV